MNETTAYLIVGVLAVLFACAMAWLYVELRNAPEGYEDSDGFHKEKG